MDALGGLSFPVAQGVDSAQRLRDMISVARGLSSPPKIMFAVGGWSALVIYNKSEILI